jgi:hypothetical protein
VTKLEKLGWSFAIINTVALVPEVFLGRPFDGLSAVNLSIATLGLLLAVWGKAEQ